MHFFVMNKILIKEFFEIKWMKMMNKILMIECIFRLNSAFSRVKYKLFKNQVQSI